MKCCKNSYVKNFKKQATIWLLILLAAPVLAAQDKITADHIINEPQVACKTKLKRGASFANFGNVTATGIIKPNLPINFYVNSEIDDSNLKDPNSCAPGIISGFFNKKIIIENIDDDILEFTLIVNGKDFRTFESLSNYLALNEDKEAAARTFYTFWKNQRFHASSLTAANGNPFYTMNFWGYTVCDNDVNALSQSFAFMDIPSRQIHLNGHVVCEYMFSNKWNVIDGDKNMIYLKLDNKTLASFSEITEDPFIAVRTKDQGIYHEYNIKSSWKNSSLFEFINPKTDKARLTDKSMIGDLGEKKWTLYPGEKVIFHYDKSPQTAVGKSDISAWAGAKEIALGMIELVLRPQTRRRLKKTDKITVYTPYPIYKIVSGAGVTLEIPRNEIRLGMNISIPKEEQVLRVYCQGARASFPILSKGKNYILLSSKSSKGKAKVFFTYQTLTDNRSVPEVYVKNKINLFQYEIPNFKIEGSKEIKKVWWQISGQSDFSFIIPNFERVQAYSDIVSLSKITDTFFISNKPYFFRVKAKRNGIWGNWSATFQFRVLKPGQPYDVNCELLPEGKVRLEWKSSNGKDAEYMIFGSNRFDFIPEIYSEVEVFEISDGKAAKSRPNKNLVVHTKENACKTTNLFRFYRIVTKIGNSLSTPSSIIITSDNDVDIASNQVFPAAKVLQTRWIRIEDKNSKMGYRDVYRAVEMNLKL